VLLPPRTAAALLFGRGRSRAGPGDASGRISAARRERGRRLDHQLNPARPDDHGRDPAIYARYATVVVPDGDTEKTLADAALVEVLQAHTPAQPWWLGYLDTGVADLVAADAPKVAVYVGWPYVLLEGGPESALSARRNLDATPWHSALPELVFPRDRFLPRLHVVGRRLAMRRRTGRPGRRSAPASGPPGPRRQPRRGRHAPGHASG